VDLARKSSNRVWHGYWLQQTIEQIAIIGVKWGRQTEWLAAVNKAEEMEHKAPVGLRTVALFEFVKGFAWLVGGINIFSLRHADVQAVVENLWHYLHVDPAWGFAKLCLGIAAKATHKQLVAVSIFAAFSAVVRFAEAYGLWHERHWAEWFAVLSAGLFLPVEVWHLWHKLTYFKLAVLLINIVVVVYLVRLLAAQHHRRKAVQERQEKIRHPQIAALPQSPEPAAHAEKA